MNDNGNDGKTEESKSWRPKNAAKAREILYRFVVRARRVEAHSMVRDHSVEKYVNPSMRVEYKEGQPVRIKYIMPDQEIFESLAARTRPCILASEPIYLDKVFSSINSLLNGRQLDEKSSDLLNACRTGFENLRDKNGGTSYSVQIYDKDGSPESEAMSDLLVGDGWLYSDLVHANPKGDKAEAARLPYLDRYFAGTSFFSTLAIVIVQTLKLVTDLNGRFGLGIDERAWKEQVVLTDGEDDGIVSQKMVLLPYDTKLLEGVDPSTLPGAVDATSLTEIQRVIQPNSAAEAVFLHGEETIGEFHAIHSWKDGVLTVMIADALLLEFDTTKKTGLERLCQWPSYGRCGSGGTAAANRAEKRSGCRHHSMWGRWKPLCRMSIARSGGRHGSRRPRTGENGLPEGRRQGFGEGRAITHCRRHRRFECFRYTRPPLGHGYNGGRFYLRSEDQRCLCPHSDNWTIT